MSDLRANVAAILERIDGALARAKRPAGSVQLVAVSKTMPAEIVADAVGAGLRTFGENKVQEASAKIPQVAALLTGPGKVTSDPIEADLPGSSDTPTSRPRPGGGAGADISIAWHLVGHLQSNKA